MLHMVGAETLNPHECREMLRKSQEMRRTEWYALLRIMASLVYFACNEI